MKVKLSLAVILLSVCLGCTGSEPEADLKLDGKYVKDAQGFVYRLEWLGGSAYSLRKANISEAEEVLKAFYN